MQIRGYCDHDLNSVADLFTRAVHELAAAEYDAAQRAAWAPRPPGREDWRRRLAEVQTLVAEPRMRDGGAPQQLAGFISYRPLGHIEYLFTQPGWERRGVAGSLYREAEARLAAAGVEQLTVDASLVARPFFQRQGFDAVEEQRVVRRGVEFRRFAMCKRLMSNRPGGGDQNRPHVSR